MNATDANDPVETAFADLRTLPIPDGPSDEISDRVLASIRQAAEQKVSLFSLGAIFARHKTRLAAALLIALATAAGLALLRSPGITCAEVINKLGVARLVEFQEQQDFGGHWTQTTTVIDSDQGNEFRTNSTCRSIALHQPGLESITLYPAQKLACISTGPAQDSRPSTLLETFRSMADNPSKDLGPEEIDGHHTENFVVEHPLNQEGFATIGASGQLGSVRLESAPETFTIWADTSTGDPVRVERSIVFSGTAQKTTYRDFRVNPNFTSDELSTAIPADYSRQYTGVTLLKPAQARQTVMQTLRNYAAAHGGELPPDVSAFPAGFVFTGNFGQIKATMPTPPPTQPISTHYTMILTMPGAGVTAGPVELPAASADQDANVLSWKYFAGKSAGNAKSLVFWMQTANWTRSAQGPGSIQMHCCCIYADFSEKILAFVPVN